MIIKFIRKGIYYIRIKEGRNGMEGGRNTSCSSGRKWQERPNMAIFIHNLIHP
jgi:hypothetical protein